MQTVTPQAELERAILDLFPEQGYWSVDQYLSMSVVSAALDAR